MKQLADCFHVVFFEVGFCQGTGTVCGEHFNFDDVMIFAGPQFLAAAVAREMEHKDATSQILSLRVPEEDAALHRAKTAAERAIRENPLPSIRRSFSAVCQAESRFYRLFFV
jgi:hypothetical protein